MLLSELVGKSVVDFLFAIITLLTIEALRAKICRTVEGVGHFGRKF